jgi:hypothetical protein
MTDFILTAQDANDRVLFWTGRAGDAWTSEKIAEAFTMSTRVEADRAVARFNEFSALHGLRFAVTS